MHSYTQLAELTHELFIEKCHSGWYWLCHLEVAVINSGWSATWKPGKAEEFENSQEKCVLGWGIIDQPNQKHWFHSTSCSRVSIRVMWFAQEDSCHTYDTYTNILVMCMLHSCTDSWWSCAEYKVNHEAGITTCRRVCIWICKSERPTKSYCCT